MNKYSFWQGGKKIDVEFVEDEVVLQATDDEQVRRFATEVGGEIKDEMQETPGFIRMRSVQSNSAVEATSKEGKVHQVFRSVSGSDAPSNQAQPVSDEHSGPGAGTSDAQSEYVVTDSFVTKFSPSAKQEEIDVFIKEHNLEVVRKHPENTYVFRVKSSSAVSCIKAANAGHELPSVEYSEPNLMRTYYRQQFIPTDPHFQHQWHLHTPVAQAQLVEGAGISAPDAWDITMGDRSVVVCVIDDGFDLSHPDFSGHSNKIAGQLNVTNIANTHLQYDSNVYPQPSPAPGIPGDYHGTPCAGVAVGEANGIGCVGVAPGCSLFAVRFQLNLTDEQLASLFNHLSRDVDVISCSWGPRPTHRDVNSILTNTISRLARTGGRRGRGIIFCMAAGNYNCPVKDDDTSGVYSYVDARSNTVEYHYGTTDLGIASHPDVITVAASTSQKTKSAYSNYGDSINVCAPSDNFHHLQQFGFAVPGLGITTTDNEGFGPGSDMTPNSRYTPGFGGTSSATPTVAGVCALVISRNPLLSALEVRDIIQDTADKDMVISTAVPANQPGNFVNGFSPWFGYGKVNAYRAVAAALPVSPSVVRVMSEPNVAIFNGSGAESSIFVDSEGEVLDAKIAIELDGVSIDDVEMKLVCPNGTKLLLQQASSNGDNQASFTLSANAAMRPLIGKSPRGTWTLQACDRWGNNTGKIKRWSVQAKVKV